MKEASSLSIKNLRIGYGKKHKQKALLQAMNFDFRSGEFIAVIGPNGIGKSTFLRTLAGLQTPLSGEIQVHGKARKHYKLRELAKKIAFVSTEWISLNHYKVYDLVALGRYPYSSWIGRLSGKDQQAILLALELTHLRELSESFYDELSDGEKQRVMLARALAQESDILILDEPAAFLDIAHKHELIRTLGEFCHQQNKLILFSVHDLDLAAKEADKLLILNKQAVVYGIPEDLILNGKFSDSFSEELLQFDLKKGEFYLPRYPQKLIHLAGDGIRLDWTKKALERINYQCVLQPGSRDFELYLEVKDNSWIIHRGKQKLECTRLEVVLDFLKE